MKIKITRRKIRNNELFYKTFKYKNIEGEIYWDGSGFLSVKDPRYVALGGYEREDAKHGDHIKDIKNLAKFYTAAYKDLMKIENALKSS